MNTYVLTLVRAARPVYKKAWVEAFSEDKAAEVAEALYKDVRVFQAELVAGPEKWRAKRRHPRLTEAYS